MKHHTINPYTKYAVPIRTFYLVLFVRAHIGTDDGCTANKSKCASNHLSRSMTHHEGITYTLTMAQVSKTISVTGMIAVTATSKRTTPAVALELVWLCSDPSGMSGE